MNPKLKPNLPQLLADYEKSKEVAIERLTSLEELTGLDFHLPDLKAVAPLKPMKLRFVREAINAGHYTMRPHPQEYNDLLLSAWDALHHLSQTHSAYFAAYCAEQRNNTPRNE
jgi:hypothetical protein